MSEMNPRILKLPGERSRIEITYDELPPAKKNANLHGTLYVRGVNTFHAPMKLPVGPTLHANLMALFRDTSIRVVPAWLTEALERRAVELEAVEAEPACD